MQSIRESASTEDYTLNKLLEPEVKEVMDSAIKNPTEDTIFQLASVTEAVAFKDGVNACLKMFQELFRKE